MTTYELSVVIAVAPGHPDLEPVLASVAASCSGLTTELLIVGESNAAVAETTANLTVRRIPSAPGTLVPVAWGLGIAIAQGEIIACLSSEFTVRSDWLPTLIAAVREGAVGAAGAIEIAAGAGATTAAMYFLRFSPFLPRAAAAAMVNNIPGDGALYRRDKIVQHPDLLAQGFWEIVFHQRWLATGEQLRFDPAPLVTYHGPAGLRDGAVLRYRHGVTYGSTMVLRHGNSRMRHILGAPLLPLVLCARIARRVVTAGKGVATLLRALPPLLVLTGAWSLGEATGAAQPGRGES